MFVIHPPRGCWSRIKATFPKAASTEGAAATRSHSEVFPGTVTINHVRVRTTCVRLKAESAGRKTREEEVYFTSKCGDFPLTCF